MATRKQKPVLRSDIPVVDLLSFSEQQITIYGVETNTERAIPDFYDGLKPVSRRTLWALSQLPKNQLVKSARVVGDTLGKYHPHGDCLHGDTLVYTLDGNLTPISEMRGRKWVLAYDVDTASYVPALAHSWRIGQKATRIYTITFTDGSSIRCTGNHPFLDITGEWVKAENIKPGLGMNSAVWGKGVDELPLAEFLAVAAVSCEDTDTPVDMYDFTVDGYENMMVVTMDRGPQATLVCAHNSSCYGALVTLATEPTPTVLGEGNWGTVFDPPAAYRYTNARLTPYGLSAFNPMYTPVVDYVPSFDRKDKEPLVLGVLFPQLLFNGASGIGVGMRTSIPAFTPKSVLSVMVSVLEGEKLTPEDYASRLTFYSEYGGRPVKSAENFKRVVSLFGDTKGSIEWESRLEVDEIKKQVTIVGYAPSVKMTPSDSAKTEVKERKDVVSVLRALDSVASVSQSDGVSYNVQARKDLNLNEFKDLVHRIRQMTTTRISYEIYVTERTPTGGGKYEVTFYTLTIPQLILKWLKRRVALEAKSLAWRVSQLEMELHKLSLQLLAADNLDLILQVLRSKADDLDKVLSSKLRISVADAKYILDQPVRRLSALNRSAVKASMSKLEGQAAVLRKKLKNPASEVRDQLQAAVFNPYSVFAGTKQFNYVAH